MHLMNICIIVQLVIIVEFIRMLCSFDLFITPFSLSIPKGAYDTGTVFSIIMCYRNTVKLFLYLRTNVCKKGHAIFGEKANNG